MVYTFWLSNMKNIDNINETIYNLQINETIYNLKSFQNPLVLFCNFYTGFLHIFEISNQNQDDFFFFFILSLCLVNFSLIFLILFNFKSINFKNKQVKNWMILNLIFFICLYCFVLFLLKILL